MALSLGRHMFIDLKECTVTAPLDCNIPTDRLKKVPAARMELEKPTPMTERVLRLQLSRRFCEIRALEAEGAVPRNPEKVKELHDFAITFRKSLPPFFRQSQPDTTWDEELRFLPIQRELISYMIHGFLMALHRPYIFTREYSERQVYNNSLAILDSQDRLFRNMQDSASPFYIGSTFPTFDAALLLAVVLVSSPARYHETFARPSQSLERAFERLSLIGSSFALAKTGAEILRTTRRRVLEAQQSAGFPMPDTSASNTPMLEEHQQTSTSVSPDPSPWQFELNESAMDWTTQNPDLSGFDFSNLEVPMPLKELFLDEEMASMWIPTQEQDPNQLSVIDVAENSLWNFLSTGDEQDMQ
jgi:hypothetical protein